MKERIKKLWVDALKSGNYRKTTGALQNQGCYCCLGVLCDLASKEGIGNWKAHNEDLHIWSNTPYVCDGEVEAYQILPNAVKEWAGLKSKSPMLSSGRLVWDINDNEDLPFTEMADLIEVDM